MRELLWAQAEMARLWGWTFDQAAIERLPTSGAGDGAAALAADGNASDAGFNPATNSVSSGDPTSKTPCGAHNSADGCKLPSCNYNHCCNFKVQIGGKGRPDTVCGDATHIARHHRK